MIIIVVALIAIGYFYDKGYLHFKWQVLTIIFAALAAPFQMVMKWLQKTGSPIEDIRNQHELVRSREKEYRDEIEGKIKEREQRLILMQKELELLDTKMELLKAKKERVEEDVKNMSIDDKIKKFQENYGQ